MGVLAVVVKIYIFGASPVPLLSHCQSLCLWWILSTVALLRMFPGILLVGFEGSIRILLLVPWDINGDYWVITLFSPC